MTEHTTELFAVIERIGTQRPVQEVCDQIMTALKGDTKEAHDVSKTDVATVVELKLWEAHDPNGRARNDFHVRLNDHDMAILRHLAEENEDLSMQKIAHRILVPELRRRVGS